LSNWTFPAFSGVIGCSAGKGASTLAGVEEINGGVIVSIDDIKVAVGENDRLTGVVVATAVQPASSAITEKKIAILMRHEDITFSFA
jgi:hypothetical protein